MLLSDMMRQPLTNKVDGADWNYGTGVQVNFADVQTLLTLPQLVLHLRVVLVLLATAYIKDLNVDDNTTLGTAAGDSPNS